MKSMMKKGLWKRTVTFLVMVSLLMMSGTGFQPKKAEAAGHTQGEAVNWVTSQIGKGLDYDGIYGNQCVDLIKFYYAYFGVASYAIGNANAYATNNLPSGWTRVYNNFQPGDIAVWKVNHSCSTCSTGSLGHVGIITSADSVGFNAVNQNFNSQSFCTQNWFYCSALTCAIRPVFTTPAPVVVTDNITFKDFNQNGVWDTNAEMYIKILNPDKKTVTKVGCYLYNETGTLINSYSEACNLSTSYVNYNCNFNNDMKYTLTPGTTYKFVLYAVVNGKEYKDRMRSFKTTGSVPQPKPVVTEAPKPVVTEQPKAPVATTALSETDGSGRKSADTIASIAESEYQIWQGKEYQDNYGTGWWCCYFVNWCARHAGISENIIPNTGNCQTMYEGLLLRGAEIVTSPKRGDLVLYWNGTRHCHIGIMINDTMSIQGNVDNTWKKMKPSASNYTEYEFVRPNYEVSEENETDYLNQFTSVEVVDISETDATLKAAIPGQNVKECGYYIGTSEDEMVLGGKDTPDAYTKNIFYQTIATDGSSFYGKLQPGTTYFYCFYCKNERTTFYSEINSFKTLEAEDDVSGQEEMEITPQNTMEQEDIYPFKTQEPYADETEDIKTPEPDVNDKEDLKTREPVRTAVPETKTTVAPDGSDDGFHYVSVPYVAKVKNFKVKAKKGTLVVTWKKASRVNGYHIQVSRKKNFSNAENIWLSAKKSKKNIKYLMNKKKYYVRIRAYQNYRDSYGRVATEYSRYVKKTKKTK